jgi:hypothetical protein
MFQKRFASVVALTEQGRFAAKVARYGCLPAPRFFAGWSQLREAERQTEMLFQSLLSQSFEG